MMTKIEPIKILVVDDEEIMLKLACDALRSQGHLVTGASGAFEALDKLKQTKFDFILTDIKMPEMDGLELIQAAHQIDSSMGAIFMTGYASLDTAKKAIHEGAYDYILKPFDLQEIRSAITRAIQKRQKALEDGREKGLSELFDLNRILYAAGDKKSVLRLSLEFALAQSQLKAGIILHWEKETEELHLFWAQDLEKNLFVGTTTKIDQAQIAEWSQVRDILQIKSLKVHPLFSQLKSLLSDSSVMDSLLQPDAQLILVPLKRADSTSGIIVLLKTTKDSNLSEEDLKLLAILGIQTAISLENLTFLLETKKSYDELQNLQEQIIRQEKLATQGRISAEVGHELNNFLTVIMGNFQILSMKISKGEIDSLNQQLEIISTNLGKIKRFAQGLLDFSTLKAEKGECDINDLIEKTILFIKPQNIFKNISLITELKPDLPHLVVDASQIQQVLYNLLNNAADAMGKRKGEGGTITIGTEYHPEKKQVEIQVKDTGKGMSKEKLEKLFTRGFTTKESGHGIGLSICHKIVDQHGGTIHVESELNQGTTFTVRLPIEDKAIVNSS
jgi:signal transduction histidine kinase/CheY-like chemotaxis protein